MLPEGQDLPSPNGLAILWCMFDLELSNSRVMPRHNPGWHAPAGHLHAWDLQDAVFCVMRASVLANLAYQAASDIGVGHV